MAEEAAKKAKEGGKRAQRASSNVFAAFSQNQIQELKEAFALIDQNRDGFIDGEDLKDMFASLGRQPSEKEIQEMMSESSEGPLNFTMFMNMFSEKLHGTDPEDTLRNAFALFDDKKTGVLDEAYFQDLLENMGDNFTKDEIKQTWKEANIKDKKLDYLKFVATIKRGNQDEA